MIRIGAVNIDVSHPKSFSDYLKKDSRARYVAVFNDGFRGDDEVDAFIKNHNLEKRCRSVDELADCVDIGFIQGCNWDRHLEYAMPFIKRNKPVFIDKPIVGSPADCRRLEELAAKGAVILGSSSVRYAEEIAAFVNLPEEERGRIINVFGTSGVDEFNYGIHIVEGIDSLISTAAVSCKFVGRSEAEGKICETFFVRYKNGCTAVFNTYQGAWQPFEVVIMTTGTTHRFRIDVGKIYGALLDRICDYMETGRNTLASVDELIQSVKIMLAGRISRERSGAEILLSEIPGDDRGYDGYEFEKKYAASAAKIYLS